MIDIVEREKQILKLGLFTLNEVAKIIHNIFKERNHI